MGNRANELRVEAAGKAISLASYMGFTELTLPGNVDEVSLLFATPEELEDFRRWAITDGRMNNFASVDQDTVVCLQADWREIKEPGHNPMIPDFCDASCAASIGAGDHWCKETFAVRFEFLRLRGAPWRIEAMCVLSGTAPLHESWLERYGSGCVVHVSYKLPSRASYDQHTAVGPGSSLWADQPVCRARYGNSYGRFAYYQHANFENSMGDNAWLLKPRVNLRDDHGYGTHWS